ncbi:MAG: hypothetical protein GY856_38995 [bacterium]|nr:hypothetical protein [bacterium]
MRKESGGHAVVERAGEAELLGDERQSALGVDLGREPGGPARVASASLEHPDVDPGAKTSGRRPSSPGSPTITPLSAVSDRVVDGQPTAHLIPTA